MKKTKVGILILGLGIGLAMAPEAVLAAGNAHHAAAQKPVPSKKPYAGGMQEECEYGAGMMGGRGMMGGGMMGGPGMMGHGMMMGPHMDALWSLDLSDEQRSSINKLHDELQHKNWAAQGQIMDESSKLRDLYQADKRDAAAIGAEYQKIFDLRRQMIEEAVNTHNRIEDLLTPEQRTQLKKARKSMPMRGYSMY